MNKYIKNSGKTIHLYVERFKHGKDIFDGDTPSSEVLSGVVTVRPITFHPILDEITIHPITLGHNHLSPPFIKLNDVANCLPWIQLYSSLLKQ